MMPARTVWLCAWVLVACSSPESPDPDNPVRQGLEQSIAGLDKAEPLRLRYNPAACACPPVEVRVAGQWLRADLEGDATVQAWLAGLARTPPDSLPVPMQALGQIEPEILRTQTGSYAVRITVRKVLTPSP